MERPIALPELEQAAVKAAACLQMREREIKNPTRGDPDLANRRLVLMYWLRVHKGGKLQDVARVVARTHPAVIRGVARVDAAKANGSPLAKLLADLLKQARKGRF